MIADIYKVGPLTYSKIFQCDDGSKFKGDVTKMLKKNEVKIRRVTAKYKHTHTSFVEALNKILAERLFKVQDDQLVTHSSIGLLISYNGSYVSVANDNSTLINPDYKFPSSKSNCTVLNKWHVISITWSNGKDRSNCWSNGEKIMTFNTGYIKVPITVLLATLAQCLTIRT